jgi:large subunit ribosomal protein L9
MATEVLLMADVEDLGSEGDVVHVSDGYARNYLFPKNLASAVTEVTRRRLEKMRRDRATAHKAKISEATELADRLKDVSLTIAVKVSEDDKLYGSVTATDIIEQLQKQGLGQIKKTQLAMDEPIKELGVFNIGLKLHPEVETAVKVWVVEE